ncbi:hypothetical protein [Rhizobium leguminosarum]|uniref:hypothetical protein n=1 Tax=Rhizobium leguminosarum TaxID=384 RepID=UPI001031F6BB|nr:hypothetical protein [Rhizobium leguminosarum]TAY14046.1 hypothetical protein ELH96_20870 [Rhizobium leguminosarum]
MQSISVKVEIPSEFVPHLPDAIVRFGYLHPGIEVRTDDGFALLSATDDSGRLSRDIKQEFLFCLYRQKIYAETLPLRAALIAGVTAT